MKGYAFENKTKKCFVLDVLCIIFYPSARKKTEKKKKETW